MGSKIKGNYLKKELYELIKTDESIFDFIQEGALDGLWYWDLENPENEWMNAKFWKVLGYDPEEMPHKSSAWQNIINQEDLKVANENFSKHCENPNHPYDQVVRYTHKDGSTVWIRCRGLAIRDKNGKPIRMLGAHQDISDIKRSEQELSKAKEKAEESEVRYRRLFENMNTGFVLFEVVQNEQDIPVDLIILAANDEFEKTTGLDLKNALGKHLTKVLPGIEMDEADWIGTYSKVALSGESIRFEQGSELLGYYYSVSAFQGGPKQCAVTFLDITERKQALELLQEREYLLSSSQRAAHVGTWSWKIGDTKIYWSDETYRIYGLNPAMGAPSFEFFFEIIHPEDRPKMLEWPTLLIAGLQPPPIEFRVMRDGIYRVIQTDGDVIETVDGVPSRIAGTAYDITDRKQAEEKLKKSLERYRYATKATSDAIYEWDIVNDHHHLGDGFNDIFGNDTLAENHPLTEFTQFVHPSDLPEALKSLNKTLEDSSLNHWDREYRLKKANGEYAQVIESAHIIRNDDGVAVRMIGAIRDVTKERKLERLLEQAYTVGRIGIWEVDLKGNNLYWSKITKEIHEVEADYKPDLETGIDFYKEGNSRATIQKVVNKAIEEGTPWDVELQIITAQGNERWVRAKGEPEMVEGECLRIYGIFQDIHERKEAEQDLRRTSRIMKNAQEIAHLGSFEYVAEDQTTIWSEEEYRIYGLDPNGPSPEYNVMLEKCIHPDDAKLLDDTFMTAMQNKAVYELEHRIVRPDGSVRWVHDKAHPYFDQEGNLLRYVGATLDITDRKQSQVELERTYNEKEAILQSIGDGFFSVKRTWEVTYWNKAAEYLMQTPKHEILGNNLWDVIEDATDLHAYTNFHRVMHQGTPAHFEDYYAPLDRWFDINAYPSEEGITVFFRNITETKNAEIKLAESEERLRLATVQANIAVWDYDFRSGSISRSENHDSLYGLEWQDRWDMNTFLNATHPEDREISHSIIQSSIAPGGPDNYNFDFRVIYPDGSIHWLSVNCRVIERDKSGQGIIVRSTLVDITDQKQKEKQLQESLKEKEILLAEVHHRVKNNLAVVSGLMQLQAFQEENDSLKLKLNDSVSRVKTIANIHEILYKSNSFSRLNLDENIKKLVADISHTYHPAIILKINFDLQNIDLNINQAIPVSLIVNEVVTNVFKHGFNEKDRGKLWVNLAETNNIVSLQITDNGKGLPEDFDAIDTTRSLGLQLMKILTQQLEGNIGYKSVDGKTQFTLTFEKRESRGPGSAFLK